MRSASAATLRSWVIIMSYPRLVSTGPGVAVAIVKSNRGPPVSLRSMPNTSQTTPNSNGATPGIASSTTFFSMDAFHGRLWLHT